MELGLNWIDWVIIGVVVLFTLEAFGRSLVIELLDLISFLIAFFLSFSFYNFPAKYLESEFKIAHGLSLVLGFMAVWFLSEAIFYILVRLILPRIPRISFFGSKVLAVVPAVLRSLIFIAITLVMIATFPIQPSIKRSVLNSTIGNQILKSTYALEQPVKNVFGGVANDSLTFLTIKPKTNEKVNLGFQTNQVSTDTQSETIMFNLVNQARVSNGAKPLEFDEKLQAIGRSYSEDMMRRGYFSHYSPEGKTVADRALAAEVDFLVVGENLAYAPSVESAHKGFMNSAGHRANILSKDYNKIGIGAVDGGVYGKMFTQVFSD